MTTSPSRYVCEAAMPGDDPAIRRLLREPMPGEVRISLRREPDHALAATIDGERRLEVVARDRADGSVAACGYRVVREMWIDGRVQRVGYLGGLRVDQRLRRHRRLLALAFAQLAADRQTDEADFDLTSIMADNVSARRTLERALPGLARYTAVSELLTLTVRVPPRSRLPRGVRIANEFDLRDIIDCLARHGRNWQGRPHWTADDLRSATRCRGLAIDDFVVIERGGLIRGCMAVWDQRPFKQVHIDGYEPPLTRWRGAVNLANRLTGRPMLPAAPCDLPMVFASHLAWDGDHVKDALSLLAAGRHLAAKKRAGLMSFSLPATHPACGAIAQQFPAWTSRSIIYLVHHDEPPALTHDDIWMEAAVL